MIDLVLSNTKLIVGQWLPMFLRQFFRGAMRQAGPLFAIGISISAILVSIKLIRDVIKGKSLNIKR